ncbi:MAG: flagellar motor switch protein FliM [Pseudomonadota bacterium]
MSQILSQEEVDALLRGISGGQVETEQDESHDPRDAVSYDLTSQDRIIRGRMPTLEMTNEKFVRMFRTTLSSLMRKVVGVSTIAVDMIKFGEFLKTVPVPTSLHLFRMEPLRGSAIMVLESKLIFALVDILFGGTGKEAYKVEGREFTAIENNLIKRVVISAMADMEKAWKSVIEVKVSHQRTEVNPQFVQIVPPTDIVVVINFEVEVEYTTGILSICLPYALLEPVREKLHAGFQSEQLETDKTWINRFREGLMKAKVDLVVELGRTEINGSEVVHLKKGDVIPLDQYAMDPLNVYVEGIMKFKGSAGIFRGNKAIQVVGVNTGKEVEEYGAE